MPVKDPLDKPAPVADKPSALATVGRYRKTLAAVVGAGLTWATAALGPDTHVSTAEWIALGVAVATALGVYAAPNEPLEDAEAGTTTTGLVLFVVFVIAILFLGFGVSHPFLLLLILALALLLL